MKTHERPATKLCTKCKQEKQTTEFSQARRINAKGETVVYLQSHCKACACLRSQESRRKRPEHYLAKAREWKANNAAKNKLITQSWRADNPDYMKWYRATYYQENQEYLRMVALDYRTRNRALVAANRAMVRCKLKGCTVSWANPEAMLDVYATAARLSQETGIRHDVDHIVPLTSPIVCGLHWEGNLQILTVHANAAKCNKLVEDMI
jgi:hypothetical protein